MPPRRAARPRPPPTPSSSPPQKPAPPPAAFADTSGAAASPPLPVSPPEGIFNDFLDSSALAQGESSDHIFDEAFTTKKQRTDGSAAADGAADGFQPDHVPRPMAISPEPISQILDPPAPAPPPPAAHQPTAGAGPSDALGAQLAEADAELMQMAGAVWSANPNAVVTGVGETGGAGLGSGALPGFDEGSSPSTFRAGGLMPGITAGTPSRA